MMFFLVLFIILTIVNIINPSFAWYIRYGWMVKGESGPSHAYIVMNRIGSCIALVIFLLLFLNRSFY